jgi:fructose-6-phosphate aldolase 2
MELILDTANVVAIKHACEWYNITGVTTNPTILSRENEEPLQVLRRIREVIGDRQLHVEVTTNTWEEMVREAEAAVDVIDRDIYLKIPSTREGFRAIKELRQRNFNVTATVVYSPEQAILDAMAGADYIAIYYNKQYNYNVDAARTTREIHEIFTKNRVKTKILTASFRNPRQVVESIMNGADAVTISESVLKLLECNPLVDASVKSFSDDWEKSNAGKPLYELFRND